MAIASVFAPLRSRLPRDQRITLWLAGSALLVGTFDLDIFSLALPQIQSALGIAEDRVGLYAGIVRLGVIAAFPLAFMADVVGRRRLLLITIIGMSIATVLTGFAQTTAQFLILQTLARCFGYTEEMLCFVIVAEEVAPDLRGYALSRLAMLGMFGSAIASILYGTINHLPHGWRDFYLIGGAGFAILMLARRNLKETKRFETLRAARMAVTRSISAHLEPLVFLVRAYPARFMALVAVTAPYAFGLASAGAFVSKYLQETRGFTPGHVSMLYIGGGVVSIIGYLYAGALSDRLGRRTLLAVAMPATALMFALVYLAPSAWLLAPCWIAALFFSFAANVTLSAVGSELFPTSHRATAASARAVINVSFGLAGLAAESVLYTALGSHMLAVVCLLGCAPLAIIPLLAFIPETASRTLEEIAPEVPL